MLFMRKRWLIGVLSLFVVVLAARCPEAAQRFEPKAEGVVVDNESGLMWTRDAGLFRVPLQIANTIIHEMNRGSRDNYGYSDWRIPTLDELISLIDRS